MSAIGENIRRLRIERGLSQQQLADRTGKTRSAISQYESGKIVPRMGVIESIANILGVKKTDIIGEAPAPHPSPSLTPAESELLALYRRMEPREQGLILENARAFAQLSGAGKVGDARLVRGAVR